MKSIELRCIVKARSWAFFLLPMVLCFPLLAQGVDIPWGNGNLDNTFNSPNGVVTYTGGTGNAMVIQADEKIVVVGVTSEGSNILVLRYNTNGVLDNTFGTNGIITYTATNGSGNAVAIQSDGKIVVAGSISNGNNQDVLLLRYNSDGTFDNTFGINGIVFYNGAMNGDDGGNAVAIQSDGKIVVVGQSSGGVSLLRYTSEGILDTTFGVNGVVTYGVANGVCAGDAVAILSDEKIIVMCSSSFDLLFLKFNSDGTLDASFGNNGTLIYSDANNAGRAMALQLDGKIVVVGSLFNEIPTQRTYDASVLRFNADGTLDTTFGTNGAVLHWDYRHNETNNAAAIQPDGKIVVVGDHYYSFLLARYYSDGTLDANFGINGSFIGYGYYSTLSPKAISIQSDGKVVVMGFDSIKEGLFVIRFLVQPYDEIVSLPTMVNGPNSGNIGENYTFSAGGASSTYAHPLEYRFDWGDGTYSDWSSLGSASKAWSSTGSYAVKAEARCAIHTQIESGWSEPLLVNISATEIISTPNVLYGPTNGIPDNTYSYTTGGSSSNFGHSVQYLFDWGDGTNSGWLSVGTISATHSWSSSGTYLIKVQARCATDTNVTSSWSGSLAVNIGPTPLSYTFTTNSSGLQIIVDGTTYGAPKTFNWTPGSSHTLSVSSPQSGTPGTRYIYSSWSDGGAQTHPITAPSSSTTYTATFSTQYEITITSSPLGGGTVNPSPMGDQSGFACIALVGVVCAGYYSSGTLVTLTTTPNTGYTFSGWSGDLSGTANPTSVTMNGPKNVVANFTQDQYTLTVNIAPPGSGSVSKNPDKATYTYGEQVQLTAAANAGSTFSNWSGDISSSANPITLTMDGNRTVTANFTELIGPDLTGSWTTPVTQTCKSTKKGPKCTITGTLSVKNIGNRDASSSTVKFYLSDSNTYDQGDTPLMSAATGKIKAKQSKSIKLSKSFPLGQVVTGKYIIAVIDKYNSVKEIDETNNIIVFGPIQ